MRIGPEEFRLRTIVVWELWAGTRATGQYQPARHEGASGAGAALQPRQRPGWAGPMQLAG